MTLPREVVPGCAAMVTRRCTQRQFLLRPDDETNNAFIYCLGEAAQRFGIDIMLVTAMSNHYHAVVYDRHGALPQFTEHFHKLLAKTLNALRGRWENFWSSEQVCVVRLVDRHDILDKLAYTATNPVNDHLVERAHQWPGVTGLPALLAGRALRAHRPGHFFRATGSMPATVTLPLVVPPELGDAATLRDELRALVAAREARAAAERQRTGRPVVGRRAVRRQSWRAAPTTREPRRTLRPQVAARSHWARLEALRRNRAFLAAYRASRARWIAGQLVTFPAGTYWLRRFANVPLAPLIP